MAPTPIQRRACPGLWPTHTYTGLYPQCKVTPVILHGAVSPVSSHAGHPTRGCIPSVTSLRSSYTGLYPQCKVTPAILHRVVSPV